MPLLRVQLIGMAMLGIALMALTACADRRAEAAVAYEFPVMWGTLDGKPGFHVVFIGDFDRDGAYLVDHDKAIRYFLVNQLAEDVFVLDDFRNFLGISHIEQVVPGDEFSSRSGGGSKRASFGAATTYRYIHFAGRGSNQKPGALDDQILVGQLNLADQGHPNASLPFTVTIRASIQGYVRDDGRRFTAWAEQVLTCRLKP